MIKEKIMDMIILRKEIDTGTIRHIIYGYLSSGLLSESDADELLEMCKNR